MTRPILSPIADACLWLEQGRDFAIATVVKTWGSAPCPVGSMMLIDSQADLIGSVSGGCVEGAVITEALDAMKTDSTRVLHYGVSDDDALGVGLACGGEIEVLVEPVGPTLTPQLLQDLRAAIETREPVAYMVDIPRATSRIARGRDIPDIGTGALGNEGCYVIHHKPARRLIVVGAVHIAHALATMAQIAGYEVALIEPRAAFATASRFDGVRVLQDWPDDALDTIGMDPQTAVVTLTHDQKLDDPAIVAALRGQVGYLGCLGSTRSHAKRIDRLRALGVGLDDIARIHGPVGLPIGSTTPQQIAVSILAQIIQVMGRR